MSDRRLRSRLLAAAIVMPVAVLAAEGTIGVDAGIGMSSNLLRSAEGSSETMYSAGIQFSLREDTRRLYADLGGDLAHVGYSGNAAGSELVGNAAVVTRFALVEDVLQWTLQDRFGQTRRDLLSASAPNNRETVNLLSTGPDLAIPLGNRTRLNVQARYDRLDHEFEELSTRRYAALVGLERSLSESQRVSFVFGRERISPEAQLVDDYDQHSGFVRYTADGARTRFALDAGASRLETAVGKQTGSLLRLDVDRRVGRLSRLTLRMAREFSNAADSYGSGAFGALPQADAGTLSLATTSEPFITELVELGTRIDGRLTSLGLTMARVNEELQGASGTGRTWHVYSFTAVRRLGERLSVEGRVSRTLSSFSAPAADTRETDASLGISWEAGRQFGLVLEGDYNRFSASTAGGTDEFRGWLRLRYGARFGVARTAPGSGL